MILDRPTLTFEKSSDFKEADFSIGDPQIILEYLRKNIYSNIKRAICQEIMSNARDAHREIGSNESIKVTLPTRMSPNWSCQDFGIGISPSRMEDVFIKFGCSTKRNSNIFTGAFGLGCKTPLAYTDTFVITTICNIEGNNIKYHYAVVIGENRIPKLVQMSDPHHTDEPTGTTISFNVEARDHYDFTRYTLEVSRFWNPRPKINGNYDDFANYWEEVRYEVRGDDWGICRNNSTMVIIDGIPYNLNFDSINDHLTDAERTLTRYSNCHFFFGVGELSVSLNREALYYDDRTIKKIVARIKSMIQSVRSHYEQVISTSKTLWEAAINFKKAVGFFNHCDAFLKGIKWNNMTIPTDGIYGPRPVKIVRYERMAKDSYKFAGRIRRFTADCKINFTENSMLIHGDSKSRIEYLFSQKPDLKYVYAYYQEFSSINDDPKWIDWLNKSEVANLGAVSVDTLPTAPKVPREKRERKAIRYKTYEWNGYEWSDTEISEEDLINGEGIYVPCFRRQAMTDVTCTKPIGSSNGYGGWDGLKVSDFLNVLKKKVKVYGIQKDLLGDLGDGWVTLYDYIWKQFDEAATSLSVPIGVVVDAASNGLVNGYNRHKVLGNMIDANMDKMPKCIMEWRDATNLVKTIGDAGVFTNQMKHDVAVHLNLHNIKGYKCLFQHHEDVMEACSILKHIGFGNYGYDAKVEPHVVIYLEALKNKESQAVTLVA